MAHVEGVERALDLSTIRELTMDQREPFMNFVGSKYRWPTPVWLHKNHLRAVQHIEKGCVHHLETISRIVTRRCPDRRSIISEIRQSRTKEERAAIRRHQGHSVKKSEKYQVIVMRIGHELRDGSSSH